MVATFPTLCPNLQEISLKCLPRDPIITAAVSGMILASNRNTLQCLRVDSPLTDEAYEVVFSFPNLDWLSVVVERDASSTSVVLPNLIHLIVRYEHDGDWLRVFRRATFGKLEAVTCYSESERIGDFLGAFERVGLVASVQNTLSVFYLHTSCSWNPNYSSLLPFTRLTDIFIGFSCDNGCSSTVDDDIITDPARAMPKLETLRLGGSPCREIHTGVTTKGLVTLANHCPDLSALRVHFQVASLSTSPAVVGTASDAGPTALRRGCALEELEVGEIPMLEESVSMVALTLARIFPRIRYINSYSHWNWQKVLEAICLSREIEDHSGEEHPPLRASKQL